MNIQNVRNTLTAFHIQLKLNARTVRWKQTRNANSQDNKNAGLSVTNSHVRIQRRWDRESITFNFVGPYWSTSKTPFSPQLWSAFSGI